MFDDVHESLKSFDGALLIKRPMKVCDNEAKFGENEIVLVYSIKGILECGANYPNVLVSANEETHQISINSYRINDNHFSFNLAVSAIVLL